MSFAKGNVEKMNKVLPEKNMKLTKLSGMLGLVALAAVASPYAMADGLGWYGGASVGQSKANIDEKRIINGLTAGGLATTTFKDDDRDLGFKVFGGYQFNKNLALEGGYFDLGNFSYKANTLPTGTLDGNIKVKGLNLDVVGALPITDKFSVIGRAGMAYAEAKDSFRGTGAVMVSNPNPSKRDTNYKLGVGVQYAFTDALVMRAEVERYRINDAVGNKGDIDLVSVGLIYRFGAKGQASRTAEPVIVAAAPAPAPVVAAAPAPRFEKYTLSATELFDYDSAELKGTQLKLDQIADALDSNREIDNVVITGYSDRIGSDQYNQTLSEERAVAVANYFKSKGINSNRLIAQGKGEANPVVTCTNEKRAALIECLAPNRRVEVEQITIERRVK